MTNQLCLNGNGVGRGPHHVDTEFIFVKGQDGRSCRHTVHFAHLNICGNRVVIVTLKAFKVLLKCCSAADDLCAYFAGMSWWRGPPKPYWPWLRSEMSENATLGYRLLWKLHLNRSSMWKLPSCKCHTGVPPQGSPTFCAIKPQLALISWLHLPEAAHQFKNLH